jgi:hypothetical protein
MALTGFSLVRIVLSPAGFRISLLSAIKGHGTIAGCHQLLVTSVTACRSETAGATALNQLDLVAASSGLEARLRYGFQCWARSATLAEPGR